MVRRTPSPDARTVRELKLSPEVAWYLTTRSIPLPTCPPLIKTPEPHRVRGSKFDPARVDRVLAAFGALRHTKGKWAGAPLRPDPWQIAYILAPVYGWVRRDPDAGAWVRIIRTEYVDIPRKNGKTTIAGGQAMYLTAGDGEGGAEVYAAAAGKDQARFCFDPIRVLAEKAAGLAPHVKVTQNKIIHNRSGSYFTVVSSVADLVHGANVHGAVVDELHKHKSRDMLGALQTGTGSRAQPLLIIITTADDGRPDTVYAENRKRCEELAAGVVKDPTYYGVIFADLTGDPFAETTWKAANPGYGISPTRSFMASAAALAQQSPAAHSSFLRLHLGRRTKQETRFLELADWDTNAGIVDEATLEGCECYGGLDLASTSDLCALAWDFPDGRGGHDVIWRLWAPESALDALDRRTHGSASVWVRTGLLTLTPGNVADYDFIRSQINADRERFRVRELAYDPWNSSQLVTDLQGDNAPMVQVRQGFVTMSSPTKELARLVKQGTPEHPRYRHGGNPAVRWQVDNFAVAMDAAGNVKPDKAHSGDKIDGVVAGIIALSRAFAHQEEESPDAEFIII